MNMISISYLKLLSDNKVQIGGGYLPIECIKALKLIPIKSTSILELKWTEIKCFDVEFWSLNKQCEALPDTWITLSMQ
jgi:hypothetical protein